MIPSGFVPYSADDTRETWTSLMMSLRAAEWIGKHRHSSLQNRMINSFLYIARQSLHDRTRYPVGFDIS